MQIYQQGNLKLIKIKIIAGAQITITVKKSLEMDNS